MLANVPHVWAPPPGLLCLLCSFPAWIRIGGYHPPISLSPYTHRDLPCLFSEIALASSAGLFSGNLFLGADLAPSVHPACPAMDAKMIYMDALTAQLRLGILIQWQQALDAGYVALEQALRRDLLALGLEPRRLPVDARRQLDVLAHGDGFIGAVWGRPCYSAGPAPVQSSSGQTEDGNQSHWSASAPASGSARGPGRVSG